MTPAQLTALEALAERTLTQGEQAQIDSFITPQGRNDAGIAAVLNTLPNDQPRTKRDTTLKFSSLGISEKFPALNGVPGPLAAEIALQKIEGFAAAAVAGNDPTGKLLGAQIQRQMVHLAGAGMALGSPAFTLMFAVMIANGATLTQTEADALQDVSRVLDPIADAQVVAVLNSLEG